MQKIINLILWSLLLLFACLLCVREDEAHAYQPIELRRRSLYYRNFIGDGRDPFLYPETHHESLNVNMDLDVLKYGYWDSTILSETTTFQYRLIGLHTELGIHVSPFLNVFFEHQSVHVLDREQSFMPRYPVEDAWGLEIFIYRQSEPPSSLLK